MNGRILMVEDEAGAALTVGDRLRSEGFSVEVAIDGPSGESLARTGAFDLILLDIVLPGKDGISICRDLRSSGIETPIIMVSARGEVPDRVIGLRIGADDYLSKPFNPMELSARMEAVLRRQQPSGTSGDQKVFSFGPFTLDTEKGEVCRGHTPVALSSLEYQLLLFMLRHRRTILSRDQLLDSVWGYHAIPTSRTVDVHVARLRQKLGDTGKEPQFIKTVNKQGYRFD